MAIHRSGLYCKPVSRSGSFSDNTRLTASSFGDDSSLYNSDTMATDSKRNVIIAFIFILEVLVLVFVSVLAYFLRETDVFPVREVKFSCTDESINYERKSGEKTFDDFVYEADIPYEAVLALAFALPVFIVIVCEIALWAFSDERQKTVRVMCSSCKVPQVIRRIIRFIGTFLFGLLVTMIVTDMAKLFTGRLRPTFLDTCKPNVSLCRDDVLVEEQVCTESSEQKLRHARLSFPSLHAAVTAYAAFFLAIYLHNIIRNPGVKVIRSFLAMAFINLSLMCSLARYGLHYSHWTDCLAGFILGFLIAAYLCVYVLNCFREHMGAHQLYNALKNILIRQRLIEFRELYKENWERLEHDYALGYGGYGDGAGYYNQAHLYTNGLAIPRPHVHGSSMESNTDNVDHVDAAGYLHTPPLPPRSPDAAFKTRPVTSSYHNTFQREINRAVEPFRSTYRDYNERHRQPINGGHI